MIVGYDISSLQQVEDEGRTFSQEDGVRPLEHILGRHGATHVRLRLWVDPPLPYNDLPRLLAMAKRVKVAGLQLLVDFHYADFWADPGKQPTPQRWQNQDLPTLAQTVQDYTRSVVAALASQGTPAEMVQIGNEVTNGMLWPQGQIYGSGPERWAEFTTLLKAGIAGARAGAPAGQRPRVMVHIDRGGDNAGSRYFFDHLQAHGVAFDLIGLSYYPWWHGPLSNLQYNLNDLAKAYHKGICVVETAYPWTFADGDGYPNNVGPGTFLYTPYRATPKGQLSYLRKLLSVVRSTPGGHGLGLFYWEPAWIPGVGWEPGAGDAWDNLTLFDFKGRSLPGITAYQGAAKALTLG
jgi:arabinogalactan endo-1,4-beta-galactosidase